MDNSPYIDTLYNQAEGKSNSVEITKLFPCIVYCLGSRIDLLQNLKLDKTKQDALSACENYCKEIMNGSAENYEIPVILERVELDMTKGFLGEDFNKILNLVILKINNLFKPIIEEYRTQDFEQSLL